MYLSKHGCTARHHGYSAQANDRFTGGNLKGKTWVERNGLHVDHMAGAWLVRRAMSDNDDEQRLARGAVVVDGYRNFKRKVGNRGSKPS